MGKSYKTFQDRIIESRDIIEKIFLARAGEFVTTALVRERANNAAQALQSSLEDVWQEGYNDGRRYERYDR